MEQPLLSIVIANYNYGRFLEDAIRSVIDQGMDDSVELIVCDGGSTDNSVEVIKRFESRLTWWCSEKDGGQSAAFNKGFAHAKGRFLTWLNADDIFLPGAFERFKSAVLRHPDCQWFVGGSLWLDPVMRIVNCVRARGFSRIRRAECQLSVWGPSSFFSKDLLNSVGGVNEEFHFAMDIDLWMRFASEAKVSYISFCGYTWGLRLHPDAKMSGHNFNSDGELDDSMCEDAIKRNKHFERIKRELQSIETRFQVRKQTLLSRLMSSDLLAIALGRLDLMRYKGRNYKEYFRCKA